MTTTHRIRRLSVGQTAKVMGAIYLLFGIIFAVIFGAIGSLVPRTELGGDGFMFGGIFVVLMPIIYAVMGVISGLLVAVFYNLVAGMTGGLELDLSSPE